MNPVYIRVAIYFLAPLMGMLPGIAYVQDAQQLVIDLEAVAIGLAGSALFTGAVFAKWGKK